MYDGEKQEYTPTEGRQAEANPNAQYPEIYFSPLSLSREYKMRGTLTHFKLLCKSTTDSDKMVNVNYFDRTTI